MRTRATAGQEAFNTVAKRGNCSMQRDFSWVMMNAISIVKNMACFEAAVVLGKEETTSFPCSFSPQSLTLCDQKGLKYASPLGKEQRNRKLD